MRSIYDHNLEQMSKAKALEGYRIYDEDEELIDIDTDYDYYLPQIFSVNPSNRPICDINIPQTALKVQKKLSNVIKKKTSFKNKDKKCNLDDIKSLLAFIDSSRSEEYDSWMTIGFCIYNVTGGTEEGFDLWCDFSKQSPKFDENECLSRWEKMVEKNMTIGTLKYYAQLDSPEKLLAFKKAKAVRHIDKCLGGTNTDIACLLYKMYREQFVCSSISNHTWYQWDSIRWKRIEKGTYLRKKISTEIVDIFIEKGKNIYAEMSNVDKAEQAMLNEKNKLVTKIINYCKSASFKNRVMEECEEQFYDATFRDKLDANPMIFPFKNGVYDLTTDTFRIAKPTDYMSKTAPIEYNSKFTMKSPEVRNILEHLEKVFPDESVRRYFVDVTSDIFEGGNMRKHGYFWTGHGNGGKSVTQNIIEEMLGPYDIVLPTTVITGKKVANGGANPELARAGGGVRRVTVEEPSKSECINNGTYKNLTGNDKFFARDLFEKGRDTREITPMFKFTVICNKLPKFRDPNDSGIWVRARVIPFESRFVSPGEPVPSTYEEQLKAKRFPQDPRIKKQIPGMAQAFAWYLLEHRKKIKGTMVVEPEKVMQATNEYKRQSDTYRQFEEEKLEMEDEKTVPIKQQNIISLTEIYNCFKDWFRDGLPNHSVPSKNDVKEYFTTHWSESKQLPGNRWRGYKIRNEFYNNNNGANDDDEDNFDMGQTSNIANIMG